MRISKMSRWVILLATAPLVFLGVFLFLPAAYDEPRPRYVSVAFLSHTNDLQGQTLAQFSISNISDSKLDCHPMGFYTSITNSNKVEWFYTGGTKMRTLQYGQSINLSIPSPTGELPWKFGVFASKPKTLRQTVVERFQKQLPSSVYELLYGEFRNQSHLAITRVFETNAIDSIDESN